MKKLFAIVLAVAMFASMATVASAAENTTTLTTTVPAATYTLNIPADQEIAYGATSTEIGNVTITAAEGFAEGKNVEVTLAYDAFKCEGLSTEIPFSLRTSLNVSTSVEANPPYLYSGKTMTFLGKADGTTSSMATVSVGAGRTVNITAINLLVDSDDWGKALAGEYTATITFTAEVVAE